MTIHRLALEEISEQRNVLTTVSQGRDDERWSGDAVVEVLTESPLAHPTIEILVGGRNDSNIHVLRLRGPDRPDLLVLEKPEQLDLQRWVKISDLVKEERSAVRRDRQSLA